MSRVVLRVTCVLHNQRGYCIDYLWCGRLFWMEQPRNNHDPFFRTLYQENKKSRSLSLQWCIFPLNGETGSTKISRFGRVPRIVKTKWGFAQSSLLNSLIWESRQKCVAPALPLSRSCQTPKAINPSVMITAAVAIRNSINRSLVAMSCQSWSTNSWYVSYLPGGLMGLSPRPHVNRQVREKKSLFRHWGINCPYKRFSSWGFPSSAPPPPPPPPHEPYKKVVALKIVGLIAIRGGPPNSKLCMKTVWKKIRYWHSDFTIFNHSFV